MSPERQEHDIKLMTIHWTLDPEKADGAYLWQNGKKQPLSAVEAYQAFLAGMHPRSPWYDRQERRMMKGNKNGKKAVAQELDIDYAASAPLIFDEEKIKRGYLESSTPLMQLDIDTEAWFRYKPAESERKKKVWEFTEESIRPMPRGPIWLWERPEARTPYAIFADSSENLSPEADHAALTVINCLTGNFATTGLGRWQTDQFAVVLALLGYYYNEAFLCVENNAVGLATLTSLTGRIAIRPEDDVEALQKAWLYARLATEWRTDTMSPTRSRRLGFRTMGPTKQQLIMVMRRAMEYRTDFCRDQRFWDECLGFVQDEKTGKIGNPKGDDLVISGMGAIFLAPEGRLFPPIPLRRRSRIADEWKHFEKNLSRRNREKGMRAIAMRMRSAFRKDNETHDE